MTTIARRLLVTAAAFVVLVGAGLVNAPAADAAATVTTRLQSFKASATTVTKGSAVTFTGQTQRVSGSRWVTLPNASVTIWFDADGSAANRQMGTARATSAAKVTARFTPTTSGYWTIRVTKTASLKSSVSTRLYVKVATPVSRPTTHRPPAGSWNCPNWAPIKGNASSRIFHVPGGQYYARTKPELCFANESVALRAGYRKSKR